MAATKKDLLNVISQAQYANDFSDAMQSLNNLTAKQNKTLVEYMLLVNYYQNGIQYTEGDDEYDKTYLRTPKNETQALIALKEAITAFPLENELLQEILRSYEENYYGPKITRIQNLYEGYKDHIINEMEAIMKYDEVNDFSSYGKTRSDQIEYLFGRPEIMKGKNTDLLELAHKGEAVNVMLGICKLETSAGIIVKKLQVLHDNSEQANIIKSDRGMGAKVFHLVFEVLAHLFSADKVKSFKESVQFFKSRGAENIDQVTDTLDSSRPKM